MTRFVGATEDVAPAGGNLNYSLGQLKEAGVGLWEELWGFVESRSSCGGTETERMKDLLQADNIKKVLGGVDRSWAFHALDKALDPQRITLRFEFSSAGPTGSLKLIEERREVYDLLQA
jgi:hypothetical protein